MNPDDDDPLDALAAEYVLGTLRGAACARFEERLRTDPDLARRVREWETRLTPLADEFAPAEAPDGTWEAIERRLFAPARGAAARGRARAVAFWRWFALGATSLAVVVVASSVYLLGGDERAQCYAVLFDAQNRPALVVFDRRQMRELVALPVGTRLGSGDGSAQLWIVAGGKATPVGVLSAEGETSFDLDKPMAMAVMASDARLLVTREPPGGSPIGRPGAIRIAEGAVAMLGATSPPKPL